MKQLVGIVLLLSLSLPGFTQHDENDNQVRTLFNQSQLRGSGGYGGFGLGYSVIDGKDAVVMSGRGAWLVGRTMGIGLAGYGFMNDFHFDANLDEEKNLAGGYGGFLLEPILFPRSPVHLAFPIVAGVGGISIVHSNWVSDPWEYRDSWVEESQAFLVVEPGVEVEFNLLRFFRMGLGVSYRQTSKLSLNDVPSGALNGITAGISFKFGKF